LLRARTTSASCTKSSLNPQTESVPVTLLTGTLLFRVPSRFERPWVANQAVLKSKELTSALPCLTLSDFHEISRAARP
jgi:hypothetical protein